MPRIVIPDDQPPVISTSPAFRRLEGWDVRTYPTRPSTAAELIERIADAECVMNVRTTTRFTEDVLQACPKLRLISIWGTGTDNIDLAAARKLGIRVTNTPGASAVAVAEHALTLMLSVARQITQVDQQVRAGKWPLAMVTQLHGKTLGLIGTGAIGSQLARIGRGIGFRVIAWTFHPKGDLAEWVEFDDVFRQSDVVSVHVRHSAETTGMIHRRHFGLMKPNAIFVNTARAAIVNEADLIEALQARQIAGAGLDVFGKEPLPSDSPFFGLPNVIMTPHSAGATPEATETGIVLAIENIFRFFEGTVTNVVV